MVFFHGFSLRDEARLFASFLDENDYTVAGFSYGSQQAFEYAYSASERIDKLILLSPAFFQTKKRSFVRMQLRYFEQDKESYIRNFLINAAYPAEISLLPYLDAGSREELESLLNYHWDKEQIDEVLARGTEIEVYLGGRDRIIDSKKAFDFFSASTVSYLIKDAGHFLVS